MFIDMHTHSKYSRHATGNINDLVLSAIQKGITVLAITDHAPFPIDQDNRIHPDELLEYFYNIKELEKKYSESLLILCGLEIDFMQSYLDYISNLIESISKYVDYIIGAIHTIYITDKQINIWDIEKTSNALFVKKYFALMADLINSDLFDTIAHPDSILRGGISINQYKKEIIDLIPLLTQKNITYEINTSCFRKPIYDPLKKEIVAPHNYYNGMSVLHHLIQAGVRFTIGSDAHQPCDVGSHIVELQNYVTNLNGTFVYYKERIPVPILSCTGDDIHEKS